MSPAAPTRSCTRPSATATSDALRQGRRQAAVIAGAVLAVVMGLAVVAFQQAQHARVETLLARRLLDASNLNLTAQAGETGEFGRMRNLLDETRPEQGAADLRGFEWGYLSNQCRLLLTLRGTTTS